MWFFLKSRHGKREAETPRSGGRVPAGAGSRPGSPAPGGRSHHAIRVGRTPASQSNFFFCERLANSEEKHFEDQVMMWWVRPYVGKFRGRAYVQSDFAWLAGPENVEFKGLSPRARDRGGPPPFMRLPLLSVPSLFSSNEVATPGTGPERTGLGTNQRGGPALHL